MSRPESRIQPGSGDDGTIRQGPLQGAFDRLRRHVGRQILGQAELVARGRTVLFDGYLRAYVEGRRQPLTGPFKYAFIVITIYAVAINLLEQLEESEPFDDYEEFDSDVA